MTTKRVLQLLLSLLALPSYSQDLKVKEGNSIKSALISKIAWQWSSSSRM